MPFKPGNDPNRNTQGRPKTGNAVAELARKVLESKKKGDTKSRGERILIKAADLAEAGSAPHMSFLFDRGYGKPQENVNLGGGISLYEQGATKPYDREALKDAMRRLSGAK
jgi:hypothetical protein